MLKRYKNKILEAIRNEGFEFEEFKKYEKEVDGSPAVIVQLKNTPLFFMFRTNSDDYLLHDCRYINFSPNFSKSDYDPGQEWASFEYCYDNFIFWLNSHVKEYLLELESPDYWESLQSVPLFESDPLSDRTLSVFNRVEKDKIGSALLNFKVKLVEEFQPSREQLEQIDDRLNYLTDSLDRLNKVDWQGVAISAIMSISIALSLDTNRGKELYNLFRQSFQLAIEFLSS